MPRTRKALNDASSNLPKWYRMPDGRHPGSGTPATSLPSGNNGLTLIELLVAISVLSLITILGWRGLDSIVRARIALTDDLEQTRGMQLAFAQLQSDCAHLYSSPSLPAPMPLFAEQGRLS